MIKPTRDQILLALEDLEEGKTISAELRHAVNLFQKAEVEAKLDAAATREAAAERAWNIRFAELQAEWVSLTALSQVRALTPEEQDKLRNIWMFAPKGAL